MKQHTINYPCPEDVAERRPDRVVREVRTVTERGDVVKIEQYYADGTMQIWHMSAHSR